MALQIVRVTDTTQAVTTAEVKTYLKTNYGTDTNEDALLVDMIFSASRFLEDLGQFSIASKTWKCWVDRIRDLCELTLPMPPIISVDAVYRIDSEGTETELTLNKDYYSRGLTDIILKFDSTGSSDGIPRGSTINTYPIRVEYTAGHATVPDDLKIAVMQMVADNYMNRGEGSYVDIKTVPHSALQKISGYRRNRLF